MKQLSLRPYHGRLYLAANREEYERQHKRLFKTPDVLTCATAGRFSGGEDHDGMWAYLVWADSPASLAHEFSHIIFHVFERCQMDPRDSGGEAFCYMLSQLMIDAEAGNAKA